MTSSSRPAHTPIPWRELVLDWLLVALILLGLSYRFAWSNWNQDAQLHPDEYGLTNTLTALRIPASLGEYFNTRLSPISPYNKYAEDGTWVMDGPDNRMRWGQWPMILIRGAAELTEDTGYGELRLLGRRLSALADAAAVVLLYFIGRRLYGHRIGLLGAALSALAVMQIQQSHFMTVDNFGTFFTVLALYGAVRIAQQPAAQRANGADSSSGRYRFNRAAAGWFALFGVSFGMAMACKVNLLPLGGLVLVAAFISIAELKLRRRDDLTTIIGIITIHLLIAAALALITFRVTQPMTFRAPAGDTGLLTLYLNPDWVESMKVAQMESSGVGGGPPGEQWAARPAILFPLMNLVVWGLGLPLGLAAWAGFGRAGWQVIRSGKNWQIHLLPLVWVGGYFLFMGTRWVKSIRYFLPIYPFLCLLAAWLLVSLWKAARASRKGSEARALAAGGLIVLVLGGTLAYANAFTHAVYRQDHTRIQATNWMYDNIPAPVHLALTTQDGTQYQPVSVPDGLPVDRGTRYTLAFTAFQDGQLSGLTLPRVYNPGNAPAALTLIFSLDPEVTQEFGRVEVLAPPAGDAARGLPVEAAVIHGGYLEAGNTYYLTLQNSGDMPVQINQVTISNENWDEGLPVPYSSPRSFGPFYRSVTMEVRWYDDENKRQMFFQRLAEVDYVILPSQRGIWSTARLQLTYPMTIEYYRALFDGRLGFDLAAQFDAPLRFGPLWVSDVGGTLGWGKPPRLPVFNFNFLAAEEAFSVYDHPPVWIFEKRADFNPAKVQQVLGSVDISGMVVQSPRDARPRPIR